MRGLFLFALLGTALAARFAAFSVEPFGPQRLNLDTGVTTLPQGGVLTDNESGLRLKGSYIEYKEGAFVRIKSGELLTKEGSFVAQEIHLDLSRQVGSFSGLRFSSDFVQDLRAEKATYFLEEDVLVVRGQVRAARPVLQADLLVVDVKARQGLVMGPFTFKDASATLQGKGSDARLFLYLGGSRVRGTTRVPQEGVRLEAWARRAP